MPSNDTREAVQVAVQMVVVRSAVRTLANEGVSRETVEDMLATAVHEYYANVNPTPTMKRVKNDDRVYTSSSKPDTSGDYVTSEEETVKPKKCPRGQHGTPKTTGRCQKAEVKEKQTAKTTKRPTPPFLSRDRTQTFGTCGCPPGVTKTKAGYSGMAPQHSYSYPTQYPFPYMRYD